MTTATLTADATAAAVELLAPHWAALRDRHQRHDGYRALVGGLLRAGLPAPDVEALVEALCEATSDDEPAKRVQLVQDTAGRLAAGGTVSGWPSLAKLLGDDGDRIVGRVQQLLGIGGPVIAATYDYCDEAGALRYQTVRLAPKDFRQRRRVGQGWAWDLRGVERLLYRLPELLAADPSQTVYICEGEKDVDALCALGLVATTNPMGAGKWQDRFAGPLRGRHVVILPDADAPGRAHAQQVARSLAAHAASIKVLELPGLPPAGDVSDWLAAGGTAADLERLAEAAPAWQDSCPAAAAPVLPMDPPWPDPLAPEALYGLAGDVVRLLEPATEADPAALLLQLLVGFGSLLGRTAHCRVEADRHYGNEFVVLVGRTAKGRKGTSWSQVHRLLTASDADWGRGRVLSGLSSGEGLIWHVRDPITARHPVKEHGHVVGYDEVEADPGIRDKRLLVFESEFAAVLKQADRAGNILSAVVRLAWDTGDLATLTKNSPARATGAHVSIVGHCTAQELRRYLATTEMANGFANRHLWACVQRSKELPEGGRVDADALDQLTARLREALAFGRQQQQVYRDEQARAIWHDVYGTLSADRPGLSGAMLGRAEAHVLRLSLLYALLDCSPVIRAEHLLAALAVWEFCEQSVRHVFGDALGDPVADDLLRLLRGAPDGMTRRDLLNALGRNQSSERIGRARLARFERRPTAGRPEERWFAGRCGT
jgi:hypothetical protein